MTVYRQGNEGGVLPTAVYILGGTCASRDKAILLPFLPIDILKDKYSMAKYFMRFVS